MKPEFGVWQNGSWLASLMVNSSGRVSATWWDNPHRALRFTAARAEGLAAFIGNAEARRVVE